MFFAEVDSSMQATGGGGLHDSECIEVSQRALQALSLVALNKYDFNTIVEGHFFCLANSAQLSGSVIRENLALLLDWAVVLAASFTRLTYCWDFTHRFWRCRMIRARLL